MKSKFLINQMQYMHINVFLIKYKLNNYINRHHFNLLNKKNMNFYFWKQEIIYRLSI